MRLGADRDGRLTAIATTWSSRPRRIKEFAEQTGVPTRMMYAAPNRRTTHRLAAARRPGALVDARARGVPRHVRPRGRDGRAGRGPAASTRSSCGSATSPRSTRRPGKPWSSRHLVRVPARGRASGSAGPTATRAGHAREGDWLVGTGVASLDLPGRCAPGDVDGDDALRGRPLRRRDRRRRPRHRHLDGPAADRRRRARRPGRARSRLQIGDTRLPDRLGRRRLVGHQHLGLGDRRGRRAPSATSSAATRPTATRPSGDVDQAAKDDEPRRVRLRRPVRRGAGARRHRRDPGAAAARASSRPAGSSTRATARSSSSAA